MLRLLLGLSASLLLATVGHAQVPLVGAGLPKLPTSPSSSCPQGTSFPDGCPAAPIGTSPTGLGIQFPTLLNGYAARPAWNVAGVDYRVGINSGVVLTAGSSMTTNTGVCPHRFVTGNVVVIDQANCTLNGWDLSDYEVQISASNGTITNNKFAAGATSHANVITNTASNLNGLVLQYNEFYGNYSANISNGGLFSWSGNGSVTFSYNYLERTVADFIDSYGNANCGPLIYRFNVFYAGARSGTHPDWLAGGGCNYNQTFNIDFNLWYAISLNTDIAGVWGAANTQPSMGTLGVGPYGFGSPLTYTAPITINNNTMIGKSNSQTSYFTGEILSGNSGSYSFTISNNYVDPTGINGGQSALEQGGAPQTFSGNINMLTGGTCAPNGSPC